jgi:hypothetical protein
MLIGDEEWVTVTVVAAGVIEEGISETAVLDGSRKSIADMAVARLTVVWMSQSGEAGRLFGQLVFGKAPGLARWRR